MTVMSELVLGAILPVWCASAGTSIYVLSANSGELLLCFQVGILLCRCVKIPHFPERKKQPRKKEDYPWREIVPYGEDGPKEK